MPTELFECKKKGFNTSRTSLKFLGVYPKLANVISKPQISLDRIMLLFLTTHKDSKSSNDSSLYRNIPRDVKIEPITATLSFLGITFDKLLHVLSSNVYNKKMIKGIIITDYF